MDKLQAIAVFKAVVECNGFSAAARTLGISASAATKNVRSLERHLGANLINRSTRRFSLTEAGRSFFDSASVVLSTLESAEASIREQNERVRGLVRIAMPPSFGRVTFTPELPGFFAENPEISLDVHLTDKPVDLISEGFDLVVRSRELEDSNLVQRVLHRGPMVTAASPAYLQKHGLPKTPHDLAHHRCIVGIFGSEWRFRDPQGAELKVNVGGDLTLRSGDTVREGAVASLGIAHSTWWLFRKDLAAGRLVRVLERYERDAVPISVCYPSREHIPRRVARVIDFLARICSEKPTSAHKSAPGRRMA